MSLQGSLSQLGLADVLQNALAGRTGQLTLRKGAERAVLYLSETGIQITEPRVLEPEAVLVSFVHRGLVPEPAAQAALKQANGDATSAIDLLVRDGVVPREEVHQLVGAAAEDMLLDLLSWSGGEFRFDDEEAAPAKVGLVGRTAVDPGGVLLRAAQRLDERHAISDALGLHAILFVTLPDVPPPAGGDPATPRVHAHLDGQRTIDEVALLCGVGRFTALRAVYQCVKAGAARGASPEELAAAADLRLDADEYAVSRALLLQWAGTSPTDPEPLVRLAKIAKKQGRTEEQADALLSIGHLYVHRGEPDRATEVFRDLVQRRPGDLKALTGLRLAAEASGDAEALLDATLQLAEAALARDEAPRAVQLLTPHLGQSTVPLRLRVLFGRALVRTSHREGVVAQAEAVADLLGGRCRKREEREAAAFFRDAVAGVAPERGDLLRRFRALAEGRNEARRRVALVAALLLVAGTVAFAFWPASAGTLLAKARAAADTGDLATAMEHIADLVERFPEAPEVDEAYALQARMTSPTTPAAETVTPEDRRALGEVLDALEAQLDAMPGGESVKRLEALNRFLEVRGTTLVRREAMNRIHVPLARALERLDRATRLRGDTLALAERVAREDRLPTEELGTFVARTQEYLREGYATRVHAVAEVMDRILARHRNAPLMAAMAGMRDSLGFLDRMLTEGPVHVDACLRLLAMRELDAAYEACRVESPRLLVAGRIADASACYESLGGLLARIETDPVLQPLRDRVTQRQIPQFLAERRGVVADIRRSLEGAAAAEEAGDLDAAARVYASLAKKYFYVRFENVFRLPLLVESVPSGARVAVDGEDVARTPTVVRYRWGSKSTVTISAPGYDTITRVVEPSEEVVPSSLAVQLVPTSVWTAPVDPTVVAPPLSVGDDVLVVDRSGRVTLLAAVDGRVRWARHVNSVEGVRSRPVLHRGTVVLPMVDGRVVFLTAEEGDVLGEIHVGRPVGQPALLEDLVLIATQDGKLVGLRGQTVAFQKPLPGAPSTGVLPAHGAAWVGTTDGHVVRATVSGQVERLRLGDGGADVLGIAEHADGLYATTSDGTLHALDRRGEPRWTVTALGQLVGGPAVAADRVAVVDRRGRVLLFHAASAAPEGQVDLKGEVAGHLVGEQGLLMAAISDGRLWIHDAARGVALANVDLGATVRFAPAALGGGRAAVPAGNGLAVILLPRP
jgi:outer membrane protein assembly factor BamB/tetratricopeptide (TPR) repeat protein